MSAEAPSPADPSEGSPAVSVEPDRAADAGAETLAADSSILPTGQGDFSAPDEAEDDAAVEEALRFALDTFLLDLSDDEGGDEGSKRDAAAVDAVLHEVVYEALRECDVEGDEAVADDAGDRADGDGISEECRRMILELDAALHFAGASDDDTLGATVDVALDELVDAVLGEYCNAVGRMMFELDAALRGAGASEEDYVGAAVDEKLDALLDAFGPKGPSAAERARAAAVRIQAVHRGNAGRARVAEMRANRVSAAAVRIQAVHRGNAGRARVAEMRADRVTEPLVPRAPSAPAPANKSVRRRLERSGAVFAERTSPPPEARLGFISSLDAEHRARLYRKIDLAFAFDLQGGSVLDGPDDRDEDGASRATEESDAGTPSPEGRGDEDENEASPSPERSPARSGVESAPNSAFHASRVFPSLLEDSFDDGEVPSPRAAKRSPGQSEKNPLVAFVDVGPELDPDVRRGAFGGGLEKRGGGRGGRGRAFGESSAERLARENELRWRKERREREKRKLEDERRRFEALRLELEAIEIRRREQAQAREDKKAAEAELRSAREENKKLERRVREERLAWEMQGKRLMAEQMERRRGGFPASASGRLNTHTFAKRDPLYVRMRKAFEDHAETEAEETRRAALEERRARKTGGARGFLGADAKKSRFQTVFEATRFATLGGPNPRELDETALAFLPPVRTTRDAGTSGDASLEQAAARFVRQRWYGQIVKRSHAPRVDPDARMEIARRADAVRPGFENLSALVPVSDPALSLVSPGGKPARVYDEKGVGRYATAKKRHVPYRYANEVAPRPEREYDVDGRRVRRDDGDDVVSRKDGPFGPFPKPRLQTGRVVGTNKAVPKANTGGFRSGQRALSRTEKRRARTDAANAATERDSKRDPDLRASSSGATSSSPYARLEARDPRDDARHDPMIGFDPRIDDEEGNAFLETLAPGAASAPSPPAKGKGFRTLLRERQLAAIEARAAANARELSAVESGDASAGLASKRNAYVNIDDIPCVGASTFGRTEGLAGLEDAEKKDSLDGSEPNADGEEEGSGGGGGDDDDDDDDGSDHDGGGDDDEEEEEEEAD